MNRRMHAPETNGLSTSIQSYIEVCAQKNKEMKDRQKETHDRQQYVCVQALPARPDYVYCS